MPALKKVGIDITLIKRIMFTMAGLCLSFGQFRILNGPLFKNLYTRGIGNPKQAVST